MRFWGDEVWSLSALECLSIDVKYSLEVSSCHFIAKNERLIHKAQSAK
jgi:hypothetical protein